MYIDQHRNTLLSASPSSSTGLNHIGVIKCLHENRLLPRIISGASSGSIMAALMCTRTDEEIPQMFDPASVNLVGDGICHSLPLERRIYHIERMGNFCVK